MISTANRLLRVSGLIARFAAEAQIAKSRIGDRDRLLDFFTGNVSKHSRRGLEILDIDVDVIGYDHELMRKRNFLLVGNHMSYVDAMVISSVEPVVFVTSKDMGETPVIGRIAEFAGSIFIERRHRGQVEQDLRAMSETLRAGHNVMIYPEGTSTNGEDVLPFKKSLLMAAVEAGVDILPVVTKYVEIDGEPFGPANRDKVCWYGDMDFLPSYMGLMRLKTVKAELHFLEPIKVTAESTRAELAERSYNAVRSTYLGIPKVEWSSIPSSIEANL